MRRTKDRVGQFVTPLEPFEATAMESAVAAGAVAGSAEVVTDGVIGRCFAPEDAESTADTVEPLLDVPEARRRMAGRPARGSRSTGHWIIRAVGRQGSWRTGCRR